jgi:hypothetical protein
MDYRFRHLYSLKGKKMGHFAKVCDGKVIQVIVAELEFFDSFIDSSPGQWIQTSYNTKGGIHLGQDGKPDGKESLRGNYAGIGYVYDATNDVFYEQQPFPSWTLNNTTWLWEAPVAYPTDGKVYKWNESITNWEEVTL